LPRLVWHEDEPIAFPSSVPLYFVSRLAREHVKVVLIGEGADELFLGYNRYRVTAWNERLQSVYVRTVPSRMRDGLAGWIRALPRPARRYGERTFLALEPGPRELFYENFAVFRRGPREDLVADRMLLRRDPYAVGLRHYEEGFGGALERMGHADLQTAETMEEFVVGPRALKRGLFRPDRLRMLAESIAGHRRPCGPTVAARQLGSVAMCEFSTATSRSLASSARIVATSRRRFPTSLL
jgi:hypothetical protein